MASWREVDISSHLYEAAHRRLCARYGERVEPWWRSVPGVIAELCERWALGSVSPVGRGNTSFVLRCRRADGSNAILKLIPDLELALAEATALRRWSQSDRVPALWNHDPRTGALLLEAISNETPLSDGTRSVTVADVAGLIHALHSAGEPSVRDGVVPLADRVEFIFGHWIERYTHNPDVTDVVPIAALRRGHQLASRLAASSGQVVLLHGDLHPANVLYAGMPRGLVAIDPRPCIGEPAFDLVDWVFWHTESHEWEARSHELSSSLGPEHERLWAWCSALAPLIAASGVRRGEDPEHIQALLSLAA